MLVILWLFHVISIGSLLYQHFLLLPTLLLEFQAGSDLLMVCSQRLPDVSSENATVRQTNGHANG